MKSKIRTTIFIISWAIVVAINIILFNVSYDKFHSVIYVCMAFLHSILLVAMLYVYGAESEAHQKERKK